MVDRTDIDALLIGALYGELTPADEARLMAHLESHPADRTALDNLTRTRAAVRDSRILTFQAEPPPSISALLLQEASRRAPRRVDHSETWFQRFVRSFMAHPAMAAAATLVLVIAAAGTFYLRGTDQFAQTAAPERAVIPAAPSPAAETATAPAAVAPTPGSPGAYGAGTASRDSTGTLGGAAAGSGVDPARFDGARLDDSAAAKGKAAEPRPNRFERGELRGGDPAGDPSAPSEHAKLVGKADGEEFRRQRVTRELQKQEAVRGIELRSLQLTPKDLKDSEKETDEKKPTSGPRASTDNGRTAGEPARPARNAGVAGGAAVAAEPMPPPPPAAQAPSPAPGPRGAGPTGAADSDLPQQAQAAPASDTRRPVAKPAPSQQPPSSANNANNAQAERRFDKTASAGNTVNANPDAARQAQLLDWARKQREQVIALVNANRCLDAASAAVEIYNRAPEYFNASVATDRQIKPCLAYVNGQRDRAERSRANKNAADVQAPAQAAPTRK
jgi:hypothetical protein